MSRHDIRYVVKPGGRVEGKVRVPSDKSISHRSVMLGALAEGETTVTGLLEAEDTLATVAAFRDMGVEIDGPNDGALRIHGVGLKGLQPPTRSLDMGNSGTAMRLMCGVLSGQNFASHLVGDESLSKRPMERVAQPLRMMGAKLETHEFGCPPVTVKGGSTLHGISYEMQIASAQVKSCILLAGLYAEGETLVEECGVTRDHTERMLRSFGYELTTGEKSVSLRGGGKLTATHIDVPADISSAAFFIVAAAITPGSDLLIEHVGINPTRTGVLDILREIGADIEITDERMVGYEPVADIRVRYAPLKGIEIPQEHVASAIDEFPILFVAAACASGTTILSGAEELRFKESDRIQAMVDGLSALGIEIEGTPDGAVIHGGTIGGGRVSSCGDHRIAMAFAVAGLKASGKIEIDDCANVATSFPGFVPLAAQVGLNIQTE